MMADLTEGCAVEAGQVPHVSAVCRADFKLGVVMLQSRFSRLRGDIGNPESFPFPVIHRRVEAATVPNVVVDRALDPALAEAVLEAARSLQGEGASLIATSCGFLGGLQSRLQSALSVPVIASALMLLPLLRALYGAARPIGVLTFDSTRLSARHFGTADAGPLAVEGLEGGAELHRVIFRDLTRLDQGRAARDAVEAARRLVGRAPEVPAVLLECTNLSPYRSAIARAAARPVYDLNQAILWHAQAAGISL